jgi:hypothetical protein
MQAEVTNMARRATVAGTLAVTDLVGFLLVIAIPRFERGEDFRVALVICFVFGVPWLGMKAVRRLVSDQRSNAPGYLAVFVNLLLAAFDPITEDIPRLAIALGLCIVIFAVAFVGTYWDGARRTTRR